MKIKKQENIQENLALYFLELAQKHLNDNILKNCFSLFTIIC